MSRRRVIAALAVAVAALFTVGAMAGVVTGKATKPKVVQVLDTNDGGFVPTEVRIRKNGKVKWKWGAVFDNHNVTLTKGPRGVKKSHFRSQTTSNPDYRFTKRFKKPGTYKFICTIHPTQMKMKVEVRRPHRH